MTIDNLVPFLIVAVVVISSVVSALKKAKRGFDAVVEKQRAEEPQRLAALKAQLAQSGAPPEMQSLIAKLESRVAAVSPPAAVPQQPAAYAAQTAYAQQAYTQQQVYTQQPAYAPPQAQVLARRQRPQQHDAMRAPASVARSMDVSALPSLADPAPRTPVRRTLAEAFGDPAHARNAVILLEVLAPPVALR